MTAKQDFLGGQPYDAFSSSNVASARYNGGEDYLELGFKNGGRYGYHDVGTREASSFFDAKSKGGWVWDNLRLRGTVFGHQKPYAYIAGRSSSYMPKYYSDDQTREAHRRIGPSGHHTEYSERTDRKVPMAYHAPATQEQQQEAQTLPMPQPKKEQPQQPSKPLKRAGFLDVGSIFGSVWKGIKGLFGGQKKALGGEVEQQQGTGGDDEPIYATPGEYVVPKHAAQKHRSLLDSISGHPQGGGPGDHFAAGGPISKKHYDQAKERRKRELENQEIKRAYDELYGKDPDGKKGLMQGMLGGVVGQGGAAALAGGPAGIALFAATAGLAKFQETTKKLEDSFISLRDPVSLLSQHIRPFAESVSKYDPAGVERMNLAFDNLTAAAGKMFTPIIDAAFGFANELNALYTAFADPIRSVISQAIVPMREVFRGFAVGIAVIAADALPTISRWVQEFAPLGKAFGEAIKSAFSAVVPLASAFTNIASIFLPFPMTVNSTVEALKEFAIHVDVTSGLLRDAAARISGMFPSGNSGESSWASKALSWGASLSTGGFSVFGQSALGALAGGQSIEQRYAAARAAQAASGVALGGNTTMAAQPARHTSIEEIGLEARRQAYSGRSSIDQVASNTQQILQVLQASLNPATFAQIKEQLQTANALNGLS